jgi:hypothetical protein
MTGVAAPWERAFDGANTSHGVILRIHSIKKTGACAGRT